MHRNFPYYTQQEYTFRRVKYRNYGSVRNLQLIISICLEIYKQLTYTYAYDAQNRLISVDSGSTASYGYDHQGRRVSKAVTAGTTAYVYNGDQVIAEYSGLGTLLRKYIYAPRIDEPISEMKQKFVTVALLWFID